jgi:hypothetical protein
MPLMVSRATFQPVRDTNQRYFATAIVAENRQLRETGENRNESTTNIEPFGCDGRLGVLSEESFCSPTDSACERRRPEIEGGMGS